MMFMMPMLPTSRLTAAMPASSQVNTCVVSPSVFGSAWFRSSRPVARSQMVLAPQQTSDFRHGGGD
jgi:hypothetical protein